ncbi:MAG: aspartyl-phosphate phosphatase Spo0E family protein [Bacillota bacterium]
MKMNEPSIEFTIKKKGDYVILSWSKIYQKTIRYRIEIKQKQMLQIGVKYGLTDHRTVKSSQELDKLITKYQELNYIRSAQQH